MGVDSGQYIFFIIKMILCVICDGIEPAILVFFVLFCFFVTMEGGSCINTGEGVFKIPEIYFLYISDHICEFPPALQTFLMLDCTCVEVRNKVFIDKL
jgi:hypothetical protein